MSTLSDVSQSGIGWVYPPQPQTDFVTVEEVIGILSGSTALVNGQDYIDIDLGTEQPSTDWLLMEASIINIVDVTPVNVWPGVLTSKTTTGFRIELNGIPDTENYYLNWSIRGAFGYYFSGPVSGELGSMSSPFTVRLPDDATTTGTIVITPSDGGEGGTFTPSTVNLTAGAPVATFRYTPNTTGTKTITVSNDRGLTNPAGIGFGVLANTYTFSGPSSGTVGVASTDFTVALPVGGVVVGTVIVTPSDGGAGGTFTPSTASLSTGAPSDTFTYTPSSSGAKTLSVTNDGGLTNPGNLTYTAAGISDGDPVSIWPDSSVNGNDGTQSGSARPIFKTNIINGKPVVRFASASSQALNLDIPFNAATNFTSFTVMKAAADKVLLSICGTAGQAAFGVSFITTNIYHSKTDGNIFNQTRSAAAFHVGAGFSATGAIYVDGADVGAFTAGTATVGNLVTIGRSDCDGDIAEIILYEGTLSGTDRANIEKYLGTKYGITVAGGSAVQPDTVSGIKGWWKADSLL